MKSISSYSFITALRTSDNHKNNIIEAYYLIVLQHPSIRNGDRCRTSFIFGKLHNFVVTPRSISNTYVILNRISALQKYA